MKQDRKTGSPFRLSLLPLSPLLPVGLALLSAIECGKSTPPSASALTASASAAEATGDVAADDDAGEPMQPREAEQWAQAGEGEAEERMRLADLVGCSGLRARASRPDLRPTAIRAMEYCSDFSQLPWLAQTAAEGDDADARGALDAIIGLAARPRRATDPEDADELHAGCGSLLSLARAPDRPRARRVLAIGALRMLADRGCVKRTDIPVDLDAR